MYTTDNIPSIPTASIPDTLSLGRLKKYELQSVARKLLTQHRVCTCLRSLIPGSANVPVWFVPATQSTHYSQLLTCGSVWVCPVCAAKVSERRRAELETLLTWATERAYTTLLITYTFSHARNDLLDESLNSFLTAQRRLTGNKAYKTLSKKHGFLYSVKALEVTWGAAHGWHPHTHWIIICKTNVATDILKADLFKAWLRELNKLGLTADLTHGLDIRNTYGSVADYVTKFGKEKTWGAEHELSKAHLKKGRDDRYAPFQFLEWFGETGDYLPAALFHDYARFFHGRRQLVWSRGLKKLVGLVDKSDDELAKEVEQDAVVLAVLTLDEWKLIKRYDLRGQLLEVARSGDAGQVRVFVDALKNS